MPEPITKDRDKEPSRGTKTICISFESEEHYRRCLDETSCCREHLESVFQQHAELFPRGFELGFIFKGTYHSKKLEIDLRRIKLEATRDTFQIRPSFVMPYMIGYTDEIEKGLFLRQWGVPFDALAHVFGKDPAFWYRATMATGRPSIVGSTVKSRDKLPDHLVADEKHTRLKGEKVYVPTTAAAGCILGASAVASASALDLGKGYGDFAAEARELDPEYRPATVCTDGWEATWNAWWGLFSSIVVLLCYLHSAIKIRDCRKSGDERLRFDALTKVWEAFKAETKASFSQRLRRLREWASATLPAGRMREAVYKLCGKREFFALAYDFVAPYRTSNAVDRLMNHQDRMLYAMRYFHGDLASARMAVRAMAMLWNFHPYGARLRRKDERRRSPFADLNGFEYHSNWLHNFLIASSLGGHRRAD
ncbi:MAG: hypothetical protein V1912_13155 [bacterium]